MGARLLLSFFGLPLLLALAVCPVTPGGEHKRDHESDSSEREVSGGAERVLRRVDHARVLEAEDDHEAERDARHHRADQVADQQPLGVVEQQNHGRDGDQRRVERGGEGEEEDVAHASS